MFTSAVQDGPESWVEKRIYRFDEFSVDPLRRVLLRDGEVVAVTPKALAILLVLLENRGEVVAKDELIRQVWASAYVSDANLTQTVSSLRKALGDRTGGRRYVVTVPGQGYCFVSPVSLADDGDPSADEAPAFQPAPGSRPSSGLFPIFPEAEHTGPIPAELRRPVRENLLRIGLGLSLLAALLVLSIYLSRLDRGPLALPTDLGSFAQPRRPAVAVLGFRDLSGRPETRWLGSALSEMLTTELAAGTRLRVVSRENVARAHPYLDALEAGAPGGPADLEKVRSIVGADLLVVGAYLALDEGGERRIRLDIRVLEVPGGDIAASLAEVGPEAGLFELVARTGAQLRQRLGFDELSPQQARAARALRPSDPEAMRLYAHGLERLRASDGPGALDVLRRSAGLEPDSAVIHSALSEAYGMLGYDEQALDEQKRATALAGTLAREPRLGIQARFYELNRDWNRASETYRSLWTFHPDNLEYGLKLANCLMRGGRPADALETVAALRRLPPPEGEDARADVLEARIGRRLGDPAVELRAAEAAVAKGRRSGEALLTVQGLVFQGDALLTLGRADQAVGIFREALELAGKDDNPMIRGMAYANLGFALMNRGDLDQAEAASREALAIAERIGSDVGISAQYEVLGDLYRLRGDLAEAQGFLERALAVYVELGDRTLQGRLRALLGLTLWARGDLDGARVSLEQAQALSHETGDRATDAEALGHLGRVLASEGELKEALRQQEQAFYRFRRLGDPGKSAGALAQTAIVLGRLGRAEDVETARRRLEQVLQTRRRLGDRIGIGEILGALSEIQYRQGDLAAVRRLAGREAQIAGETGSRTLIADALRGAARAEEAADRLPLARQSLERALETLGPDPSLAEAGIRLDLARLAIAEGRSEEAGRLAEAVAAWYGERGMDDGEADALAVLADALLRQRRLGDARRAGERSRILVGESDDRELRVRAAARLVRVETAGGTLSDRVRAAGELRRELAGARESGLVAAALEARLALGEVLLAAGDASSGRAMLLEARREAEGRGFARLAREAGQTLDTGGALGGWKSGREAMVR